MNKEWLSSLNVEPTCKHNFYKTIVRHKKEEKCDDNGHLYIQYLTRYEIHCECGKKMVGRWFVDSDENLHQMELRERMKKDLLKEWEG